MQSEMKLGIGSKVLHTKTFSQTQLQHLTYPLPGVVQHYHAELVRALDWHKLICCTHLFMFSNDQHTKIISIGTYHLVHLSYHDANSMFIQSIIADMVLMSRPTFCCLIKDGFPAWPLKQDLNVLCFPDETSNWYQMSPNTGYNRSRRISKQ